MSYLRGEQGQIEGVFICSLSPDLSVLTVFSLWMRLLGLLPPLIDLIAFLSLSLSFCQGTVRLLALRSVSYLLSRLLVLRPSNECNEPVWLGTTQPGSSLHTAVCVHMATDLEHTLNPSLPQPVCGTW